MRTWNLAAFLFLFGFLCSRCEAKSYKVIVGYENYQMELHLPLGRNVPLNGDMPAPSSPQLEAAFPPPKNIQTVVPIVPPAPDSPFREGAPHEFPKMAGFEFPPGSGNATSQGIKDALDSVGRKIVTGITFEFDSADLAPSSKSALEAVLGYLQSNPGVRIIIEGHCDTSGDTSLNPVLSQNRANSVKSWLVSHGADGSLLTPIGRSDSFPIADNGTPEGQALNRRVELVKQ